MSAGLPQKVTNIRAMRSSSNNCTITWERPDDIQPAYITRYKVWQNHIKNEKYKLKHILNCESSTFRNATVTLRIDE